jgi:hypothetical protein
MGVLLDVYAHRHCRISDVCVCVCVCVRLCVLVCRYFMGICKKHLNLSVQF